MKIAILGYGKMGKAIEEIALKRNHEIVLRVNSQNATDLEKGEFNEADVAIEFSRPESAVSNITACLDHGLPVAVGTTGWNESYSSIAELCEMQDGCLLVASNFSIGVNLFFKLNQYLAEIMGNQASYKAKMMETHHTEKLDSPSGTAIRLAEDIIQRNPNYLHWENEPSHSALGIESFRLSGVPGTHEVHYQSEIDQISIRHEAFNRDGFALGAVLAAEFISNKKGIFTMEDVLNLK